MHFEHDLTLDASVDTVWALTVDVESWPASTPTVTSVERLDDGPFGVGSSARIKQPRQSARIWTVTRFEPERHFAWQTKVGTVTMTGTHDLEPVDGGTRNRLGLDLTGFGSGLLGRLAGRQMAAAIATENEGFAATAAAQRVQAGGSTT